MVSALCLLPVASTVSYTDLSKKPDKQAHTMILKVKDHKGLLPLGPFDKYHKYVLLKRSKWLIVEARAGHIWCYGTIHLPTAAL